MGDRGARRDLHAVGDLEMAEDLRGGADRAVPADAGAARHPGAARHRRVRSDAAVVADLDLVVELDAVLDHRIVERAAVDGGVGADLDVVADAHHADLGNLDPAPGLVLRAAEPVGADHRAGMHDDPLAEGAAVIHHHARIKAAPASDAHAVADDAARANGYVFS